MFVKINQQVEIVWVHDYDYKREYWWIHGIKWNENEYKIF